VPLYEFRCRTCRHEFEALVRPNSSASCPSCKGSDLERILSLLAVSSESTRATNLARARKAGEGERRDKREAEMDEIRHHSH
jgi:putative FmdB family regulatory protein